MANNNIDLKAILFNQLFQLEWGEHFSIGGGPIFATGSVNYNRNLTTNPLLSVDGQPADVTLDGKGITALGYTAGFMFNPQINLGIGMNYRS